MDSLPFEVLIHIWDYLDTYTLRRTRYVSLRWNEVTCYRLKRNFQISMNSFESLLDHLEWGQLRLDPLPTTYLSFSGEFFSTTDPAIEKFCAKYAYLITGFKLDCRCFTELKENEHFGNFETAVFIQNFNIFLKSCKNVQEIFLFLPELGIFGSSLIPLPTFKYLSDVHIEVDTHDLLESYHNLCMLLSQLAEHAPKLSDIFVSNSTISGITNIVSRLAPLDQKMVLTVGDLKVLAIEDSNQILDFINSPIQVEVYCMKVTIAPDTPKETLAEAIDRLQTLISMSSEVLLILDITGYGYDQGISIILPPLPELKHLTANNVAFYPSKNKIFDFPDLRLLNLNGNVPQNSLSFSGSVFEKVKETELTIKTQQGVNNWPTIVPNVEEAVFDVTTETIQEIFKFPKLVRLEVFITDSATLNRERNTDLWRQLTMGADEIPDDTICTIPMESVSSTEYDEIEGFENLKHLRYLEFPYSTIDCCKAIVYASRKGHLRPLERLSLGRLDVTDEYVSMYLETLQKYHDFVDLRG